MQLRARRVKLNLGEESKFEPFTANNYGEVLDGLAKRNITIDRNAYTSCGRYQAKWENRVVSFVKRKNVS